MIIIIQNEDQKMSLFHNGWEALAGFIVLLAVENYRECRKILRRNPEHRKATERIREVEDFFLSPWFSTLSEANGREILKRLMQET